MTDTFTSSHSWDSHLLRNLYGPALMDMWLVYSKALHAWVMP